MKILITGDLHLTDKVPSNRVDNYKDAVLNKFDFILQTARNEYCKLIISPGDFFDSPDPSYSLFSEIVQRIKKIHPIYVASCWGQHDLRYRSKDNTALKALAIACSNNFLLEPNDIFQNEVHLLSAGWEEEIPKLSDNKFSILVTHRMIIDEKLWVGQESFEYANVFLRRNPFNCIISGDNHKYFVAESRKRLLVNCGSMMRSSIDQVKHEPTLVFFDTDQPDKWYNIDIPIEPADKVFKMDIIEKTKERNEKLDSFIEGLSTHKEMGMSFGDNLAEYMKINKIDKAVQDIIWEGMG